MGFSPTVENSNITVFVPKPSKESRDVLIKAASRSAEKVRSKYLLQVTSGFIVRRSIAHHRASWIYGSCASWCWMM
jgi:hypothetical protein